MLAACAPDLTPTEADQQPGAQTTAPEAPGPGAPPGPSFSVALPPPDLYDPEQTADTLPRGYRPSLPRDAIFPVYDPSFVAATDAGWNDDILVIGVDLDGEARAYPVGFLNRRELVIDMHRGIPTLVTW